MSPKSQECSQRTMAHSQVPWASGPPVPSARPAEAKLALRSLRHVSSLAGLTSPEFGHCDRKSPEQLQGGRTVGDLTAAPSPEACPEGHTEGRGCPGGSRCPGPLCRVRRALAPDGRPLTHGQPHQAVGEEAGGQEGGPQRDVQLPRDLRLDPREQAAREGEAQQTGPQPRAHPPRAHPAPGTPALGTPAPGGPGLTS